MSETSSPADRHLISLRERMVRALLAPRYGGPQHNTPGGLPLTATPEQARRHRAGQIVETVLAELPAALAQHVTRAIFALKTPSPDGSAHYQSGWDDGLEAAMDAARSALEEVLSGAPPAAPARPLPLGTPCTRPGCGHSLNWHFDEHGCTVSGPTRCLCPEFQPPAAPQED